MLERSLGAERADEIIGRLAATIERRPFEFLRRTPPEQIFAFLRNESPQTIALVVANLHTTLAAQVLAELPPENQADVAAAHRHDDRDRARGRRARRRASCAEALERGRAGVRGAGGVKSLADILNHADRTTERNVLDQLAEADAELAEEVRLLLFTFEDIVKLDDRSIQLVLKEVDQKDLALALRGVPDDVKEKIFSNMSERGAEMLRRRSSSSRRSAARRRGGAGPHRRDRAPPRGGRRDHLSRGGGGEDELV